MGNGEGRNREADMISEHPFGCLPEYLRFSVFLTLLNINIGDACDREAQEDAHPAIRRMLQEPTTSPHGWKPPAVTPGIILALPPFFYAT